MDGNCNERGPSLLADVTHIVHVWRQCSECGELRVARKWLVIRCRESCCEIAKISRANLLNVTVGVPESEGNDE